MPDSSLVSLNASSGSGVSVIPPLAALKGINTDASGRIMERVEEYFRQYGSPGHGARILVALSGGPDSIALLTVLRFLAYSRNWDIGAAHVNYRWRGDDSEEDERLCRGYSECWRFPLYVDHPRLPDDRSINRQAWARETRYDFFGRISAEHEYAHIAIGHQLNDRAETVAAAVLDAAGTFALAGIPPVRGRIIRPLFLCDRRLILEYLGGHALPFRADRSNGDPKYQRNRIRHVVLPEWELENPAIVSGLARLGEQLGIQNRYLLAEADRLVASALIESRPGRIVLDAEPLIPYDRALDPFVLRAILRRLGAGVVPTSASSERFRELRMGEACGQVEQGEFLMERSKGRIIALFRSNFTAAAPSVTLSRPGTVGFREWTLAVQTLPSPSTPKFDDRSRVFLDAHAVSGELQVRGLTDGDCYQPCRYAGHKKLADLFADSGVPASLRRDIPIVADEAGILWPVGFPVAERARLGPGTETVIEITAVCA